MTEQQNNNLVEKLFAHLASGKADDAFGLQADDAVWRAVNNSFFSEAGTLDEATVAMHQVVDATVDCWQRIEPFLTIAENDHLVLQAESNTHFKNGVHYNNKFCFFPV